MKPLTTNQTTINGGPGSGPRPGKGTSSKKSDKFRIGVGGIPYKHADDRASDDAYFLREGKKADAEVKSAKAALDAAAQKHEAHKALVSELSTKLNAHDQKIAETQKNLSDRHAAAKERINQKYAERKAALQAKLDEVMANNAEFEVSGLINVKSRVKTSSSRVRREVLNGREHIVVPTRLMVSGVLNGSKGPLYYPREEISRDEGAWNGMPLVVYHPNRNGQNVSARDPEILNTQGVGYVFKASTQNRKGALDAEAWFDIEKTRQVDKRILDNIEQGKPIEVSTGLFTTNEPAKKGSTYNGKSYDYIARDYRPDHLAILPDQIGACSLDDGCGTLMTNKKPTENGAMGSGKSPTLVPTDRSLDVETHGQQPHVSPNTVMKAFDSTGLVTQAHDDGKGVVIAQNAASVVETLKTKGWNHDSYQVKNGERTESMSKGNNRITLCSEGSRTVAHATRGHGITSNEKTLVKESVMTEEEREAVVNTLTTNCKCQVANTFSEDDRAYLEGLEDGKLKKLAANRQRLIESEAVENAVREGFGAPKTLTANAMPDFIKKKMAAKKPAPKETEDPVENDDSEDDATMNQAVAKKPVTDEEWLKSAPKGIRSAVQNAQKIETRHRTELVEKLTANVDEERVERITARYEAMDTEALEDLVEAMPTQNQEYQEPQRRSQRQSNYQGAGAPLNNTRQATVTANKEREETITSMVPPTLNYAEISEENARHGRRKKQA